MSLPPHLLAEMRSQLAARLPDTARIYSLTYPGDGAGGPGTPTLTPVTGGTVPCRLDPLHQRSDDQTALIAGREVLQSHYRLTVPYDAPLAADRRVVINNETYEILALIDDHSWRICRRALLGRLDS